ncbi:MAG TPA: UDP-N-acetylmuramoyl-tripeptide--D-alanyl-D-alanine ligase [Streptosporangiaceae bacterium]|nr:UDP-N-acetylmuramoyl-tripeptide--D-alanyl-D-alanine ligase [Streptosporangiaceae bacterium]
MIPLSLGEIARITGARPDGVADPGDLVFGPVVIDSRRAGPGGLFAAVAGERVDGHDFAAAAAQAGAVAVLATRPTGTPALIVDNVPAALARLARAVVGRLPQVTIAGITGSSGKTSTKDLTAQLVERLGPTVAPEGSYNNEFGFPLTVLRADEQTRYMVLELAARGAGHIASLCEIAPPRIGAVLNVGHAHTGEFGGIEEVARAKGELAEALPAGGVAVLNADDPRVAAMAGRTAARVVTFGLGEAGGAGDGRRPDGRVPDVSATDVRLDDLGRPAFTLVTAAGSAPVRLALHGAHNVPNALAAAAIAAELGLGVAEIADGLSAATARSRWRMEVGQNPDGVTVINDAYNANPESVRAALDALRHMARGRRSFAVLGHMAELGEESRASHEAAGAQAAGTGVAGLIVVGKEAEPILAGALASSGWHGEAIGVPDGPGALAALHSRLAPGDVVLVKASRAAALESVAAELLSQRTPVKEKAQ